MKERLILEMVRDRRIAVCDALTLLGLNTANTAPTQPKQNTPRRRKTKRSEPLTLERHFEVVRLAEQIGTAAAARRLGHPPSTVALHLRYAGLMPCSPSSAHEVETWRKRQNLYLDRPLQIREAN